VDAGRIVALRAQGLGWKKSAVQLGVGVDCIRTKAPFLGRVCFWLEDRSNRSEGAFDDDYRM